VRTLALAVLRAMSAMVNGMSATVKQRAGLQG
jgi:hypothetical protein